MGEISTSPGTSPADGSDDEPFESRAARGTISQQSHDDQAGTGTDLGPNQSDDLKAPTTIQKRRRVTRACDEFTVSLPHGLGDSQADTSFTTWLMACADCTYDQPSNRRRNPAPQYVEALENRLEKAEALLKSVLPDVDLDDPKHHAMMPQRMHVSVKQEMESPSNGIQQGLAMHPTNTPTASDTDKDSQLESMVLGAGSLHLDDLGHWDFYGQSSGMIFLRRTREQFGDLLANLDDSGLPFTKSSSISGRLMSPKPSNASPTDSCENNVQGLPAKSCARKLCDSALNDAAALFPVVHKPTFNKMFDRIYDTPPALYEPMDEKFLPLFYSIIALGCLFASEEESMLQSYGYESAIDSGDCNEICAPHGSSPFYSKSIFSTGTGDQETDLLGGATHGYLRALLGLPICLDDKDIDQELPLEVDDDYITEHGVLPMPTGKTSTIAAFNAHAKLVALLAKTIRYVYPLHTMRNKSQHAYLVSHSKIREIERDMLRWMEDLPMALRQGGEASAELIRLQQLLRLWYGHIQMVLYRPFLHYASQSTQARSLDKRSYACAAACISVARNLVHITSEMKRNGLLTGAYWFAMYTTFLAVLSLVFYVIENPHNSASQEILRDAHEGKDTLASLAKSSMAADRSSQYLSEIFEQLPKALGKSGKLDSVSQNKRPASSKSSNRPEVNASAANKMNEQTPIRWSNRSSTVEDLGWKSASGSQNTTPLANQPRLNVQPSYSQSPHQPFAPTISDPATTNRFEHDLHHIGIMPNGATQTSFPSEQGVGKDDFPDLSTMMFPSNDPFAYPNQPMSTLESLNGGTQGQAFEMPTFTNSAPGEGYNGINTPLYGPLPSYTMAGTPRPSNLNAKHAGSENMGLNGNLGWGQGLEQGQYGGVPVGLGWDAMFGEDWNGGVWTDQGFRQYINLPQVNGKQ
ncbi:MAG: hypothetical protein Q9169_004914 [Polycauliona sp. 2 TL-2023]